jgi:regulator of replication initiation timing
LRGRIDELGRQLNNANDELRELRTSFGQVTSYNEVLIHENEDLRNEIEYLKSTRKGRRRYRGDHETEGDDRQVKRSRIVAHSSDGSGEEGENDNEAARVR